MLRCGLVLAAVLALGSGSAPSLEAQARPPAPRAAPPQAEADAIARMQADLAARRYSAVILRGNALLESSRVLTDDQKLRLWELLAAAYYPPEPAAQQADSARLPLAALVRLVPDITFSPGLSWPGLDTLLERTRGETFSVAARPQEEYTIARDAPAHVTVVASRLAHFRLTSVDAATGRAFVHDSANAVTAATLALRSHDGAMPVFQPGAYELRLWVYDVTTGDSITIVHPAQATGPPVPLPEPDAEPGAASVVPAAGTVPADTRVARAPVLKRSTMLIGSLAFAGAAIAIATGARAEEPLRSTFSADTRVFVVGAAMIGAAATALFLHRERTRRGPPVPAAGARTTGSTGAMTARTRAAHAARLAAADASYRARLDEYRVTLRVGHAER